MLGNKRTRRMMKLFVAIQVPMAAAAELAQLRPPVTPGIRLVDPEQMHVTLHFVGAANLDVVAAALEPLAVDAFTLDFEGVRQFLTEGGSTTLWAGVRPSTALLGLH